MARTSKQESNAPPVTPRQMQILTRIRDNRRKTGCSPTLQELADDLGLSKVTVFEHVDALIRKGLLTRQSNKSRSLRLTSTASFPDERPTLLPLVGRIAAGRPLEAVETPDYLDLETLFTSRHAVRVLEVTGDSMIEDGIHSGDFVIYEERNDPRDGDTVVALIDQEEATLKRFYRDRGGVRLMPANAAYEPILVGPDRTLHIQGVVIGVLRRL
jgi:repressor LexA